MSDTSTFTNDEVAQILRVVERLSDVEVHIEHGDFRLHVRSSSRGAVTLAQAGSRPQGDAIPVRAPTLGRFLRAESSGDRPLAEVGQRVGATDPVCLIAVLNEFTFVKAGTAGTVAEIAVENGALVEYGQVLFSIRPE